MWAKLRSPYSKSLVCYIASFGLPTLPLTACSDLLSAEPIAVRGDGREVGPFCFYPQCHFSFLDCCSDKHDIHKALTKLQKWEVNKTVLVAVSDLWKGPENCVAAQLSLKKKQWNENVPLILMQNQIQKQKEPSCLEPILVCGRKRMFWKRTVGKGCTVTPSVQTQTLQFFCFFILFCRATQAVRVSGVSEVPETVTNGHNGYYGIICLIVD